VVTLFCHNEGGICKKHPDHTIKIESLKVKTMSTKTLREQLIGTWKLVSYAENPVDGTAPRYPMSEKPMGIIMYTADGFMSAQLMHPERKNFASGDWFNGTDAEYKQEASTYIAYTGPFHVDEEKQTLTHSMFISLFPNWTGQTQPRAVKIEGELLHLGTVSPVVSGGRTVNAALTWRRVAAQY